MATHYKRVDKSLGSGIHQVFTNDTTVAGAVTFATGDYIDFEASLGRAANKLLIAIHGAADITIKLNPVSGRIKPNEYHADDFIQITEDALSINPFRLFGQANTRTVFEVPAGFPVRNLKIVAYSGIASGTLNVTFMAF